MMWKAAATLALALQTNGQQCRIAPQASAGYVWDTLPNAGPEQVVGATNRVPQVPLSTSNLCNAGHLPSYAFAFAGIEGTEWKAAPKAVPRRLQGFFPPTETAPAPTEPPTDLAGASMVIAPLPPIGPTDAPEAPEAKAPAPATAPAPAPAKPKAPEPTPEPLKPFPGGMSVEDITGAVPALTGDFPAAPTFPPTKPAEPTEPTEPTAPAAPTVPTATAAPLLQLTTKAPPPAWTSATFPTFKVGTNCDQHLSHVAVAAGIPKPQLRLYFAGCGQQPTAVVAVDLRSSSSSAAIGEKLKDWMCQVDAESCSAALKSLEGGKGPKHAKVETMEGLVGKGICTGEGVVSSPDKGAASAEECRLACKAKIEKNAADESFDTCTGFSWDAKGQSCMTYGAWPVKKADPLAGPDASCYSMSVGRRLEVAPQSAPSTKEVNLDFFADLLSGSEGSSHMNIVPAVPNCFESFSWYSISKPIDVPDKTFEIIKYMVRKDAELFRPLAASESKHQVKVLVQPACFQDCSGQLFGACQKQNAMVEKDQAEDSHKPLIGQPHYYEPVPQPETRGGKMMLSLMGDAAYSDVFSTQDGVWAWSAVIGAGSLALGFLMTAGCIACCTYRPPQEEVDPNKVMARLLYEGPEGEREVLLQPAAFRTSTTAGGDAMTKVDVSQPPPVQTTGFFSSFGGSVK